ncbi:MAG: arginine--tRNA ligase [Eubacteriales bacterium]|nr:arginine--tRNA ligase [Eubacteriales bacterium]
MNIREELAEAIGKTAVLSSERAYELLEEPPQQNLGDYALPCFTLAKELRKSPQLIAEEIAEKLELPELFAELKVTGPYLNFFFAADKFIPEILTEARLKGKDYGSSKLGGAEPVIVEYSSANIAKSFHVGHGYSTILGQVIANLYQKLGYDVKRFNHLGDYGTQFGKLIYAWKHWGDQAALERDPLAEMTRIYVKFHREAEAQPELEDAARHEFKNLESGEAEAVRIWSLFRELSIESFKKIYKRLNIDFDNWNGEAFYSKMMPEVVAELEADGLLEESEGAKVVRLDDYGLNPCIIQKSDGTSIYATRDLAAIKWRKDEVKFKRNIYVVGKEQCNHFQQLFAVLEKQKKAEAKECVHVSFGRIKFADGDFSTRKGQIITLEELLDRAVEKTREIILANNPDESPEEINKTAEIIGVDAVIFTYIKNSRERDIFFSWDEALSFEGESAPYLLYTYARAKSILRKAELNWEELDSSYLQHLDSAEDLELAKIIAAYPEKIKQAAEAFEPSILVRLILNLARSFNSYYHAKPILKAESEDLVKARLLLVGICAEQLRAMLHLIGLETVEKM